METDKILEKMINEAPKEKGYIYFLASKDFIGRLNEEKYNGYTFDYSNYAPLDSIYLSSIRKTDDDLFMQKSDYTELI